MNERLVSLDAFRGITIAGMILVNNPGSWGSIYTPLGHAEWHGWTPTDFIFPFFLFIVGVSMAYSLAKQKENLTQGEIYRKIFRRTIILFVLGLFLALFPFFEFSTVRIPGVLQRIAVCYCIVAILFLHTNLKQQITITIGLLLFYWAIMTLIPVPGYGAGDLSVEGNLAAYVDFNLLKGHIWKPTWDPEGILSTIPALATTLSGVLTGYWLRSGRERTEITGWMFVAGWIAIITGLFWDILFPINKALWTSSYVVFTTGAALQFLAFCYWLIDVQKIDRWAKPAVIYGMNPITVFVLSGIIARIFIHVKFAGENGDVSLKGWIYETFFTSWLGPYNASLGYAIGQVLLLFALAAWMYRKRIFIKI